MENPEIRELAAKLDRLAEILDMALPPGTLLRQPEGDGGFGTRSKDKVDIRLKDVLGPFRNDMYDRYRLGEYVPKNRPQH